MPVVLPIAIDLSVVLVFALLFALAYIAATSLEWLGNSLASVLSVLPFGLGKKAGNGVKNLALPAAHYFGGLAAKADHRMAKSWHATAHLAEQTGHALKVAALATWQLGDYMHRVVRPAFLHATVGRLTKAEKVAQAKLTALGDGLAHEHDALRDKRSGPIPAAIHAQLDPIAANFQRLAGNVSNYSHALPLPQAQALPGEVADLRARARGAAEAARNLWERVKGLDKVVTGLGAVALVATAIGKLGGGWIFCRNWKRLGRGICRSPAHFIDDLLGLVTDFLVLTNICTILPWLEDAASTVGAPLISALSKAGAGVCHGSEGPLGDLQPPALHLPASGALPTLHLP